ncbi:hypothetical protein Ciccas_001369 [Cichlidogyrus casuarinus]|uniref:Polycomb protein EED n=1 Tax=Cichlidogyrus casuarinus TaxID=1844966 RepID=A0ABD2QNA9_9PLAT
MCESINFALFSLKCTIYQILTEDNESLNQNIVLLQNFSDPQGDKEEFFCCAWTRDIDDKAQKSLQSFMNIDDSNGLNESRLGSYPASRNNDIPSNQQLLAIAGKRGVIRILCPSLASCPVSLSGHGQSINEIRFHPKHPLLLFSFSKDHTIRLWNIATRVLVCIFGGAEGHRSEVLHGDVSLSGNLLLSAGMDHTIKVWRLDSPSLGKAIQESFAYRAKDNPIPYPTILQHFPEFSSREVHGNYIDCARWYGSFVISKSCENKVTFWRPGTLDQEHLGSACENEHNSKSSMVKIGRQNFVDNLWLPKVMQKVDGKPGDICGVPTEHKVSVIHQIKAPGCDLWYIRFDLDLRNRRLALGTGTGPSKIYVWDLNQLQNAFSLTPQVLNVNYSSFRNAATESGLPLTHGAIRHIRFANNGKILIGVGDNGIIVRFDIK